MFGIDAAQQLRLLCALHGKWITITRGSTSVTAQAVNSSLTGVMTGQDGVQTEYQTTDWMVIAADLGVLGKPLRGDLLVDQSTSTPTNYVIFHPDEKTPAVQNRDRDGLTYRIHSGPG